MSNTLPYPATLQIDPDAHKLTHICTHLKCANYELTPARQAGRWEAKPQEDWYGSHVFTALPQVTVTSSTQMKQKGKPVVTN